MSGASPRFFSVVCPCPKAARPDRADTPCCWPRAADPDRFEADPHGALGRFGHGHGHGHGHERRGFVSLGGARSPTLRRTRRSSPSRRRRAWSRAARCACQRGRGARRGDERWALGVSASLRSVLNGGESSRFRGPHVRIRSRGACVGPVALGCRESTECQLWGRCVNRDGQCVAASNEHCRGSVACDTDGACTARDGRCVVATNDDCKDALVCVRRRKCRAIGGQCVE